MTNNDQQFDKKSIKKFEILYTQFIDHSGKAHGSLPDFVKDPETLKTLYRWMVLTRIFDTKAIALQRTGKMGTYASVLGQEAVATAIGHTMAAEDVLIPCYREYAAQFQRGVAMSEILLYWGGDERGMAYKNQPQDFPIAVPIATQLPHAAGVASAIKLRNEKRVAVTVLGDGATSKGDFYEAINLAGAWDLPMVVVVTNNQWAISVPRSVQSHAPTLAQKAIAAGIDGEQVDGNDIIAMEYAMEKAIEKARSGGGPSLIEAITYRMSDHTTADDASRYRSDEEVEEQKKYDPIIRMKNYLTEAINWSDKDEEQLIASCTEEVEAAVEEYLNTPAPAPESMFDYLYEKLPDAYQEQRDELVSREDNSHE